MFGREESRAKGTEKREPRIENSEQRTADSE